MFTSEEAVARLLDAVADRIRSVGWRRGDLVSQPSSGEPACLWFTVRAVAGLHRDENPSDVAIDARMALLEVLPVEVRRWGLTHWNDAPGRTQEDVVNLVVAARQRCGAPRVDTHTTTAIRCHHTNR